MENKLAILGMPLNTETERNQLNWDPFESSMFEFIRYCLHKTANALHHAVCFSYDKQSSSKKTHFFLSGYKTRKGGWTYRQQKIYGNPDKITEGQDIKWLLKNLRWHLTDYARQMELYDDVFDDITGFLLFDILQNGFIDTDKDMSKRFDEQYVSNVFNACLELISAIAESKYYQSISEKVVLVQESIEKMLPLVSEFASFLKKKENVTNDDLSTQKVLDFLQSNLLINQLKQEAVIDIAKSQEKPLTYFFLHNVIPRFDCEQVIGGDSGIVADDSTNSQLITSMCTPNVSMDSSLVIIDHLQSTPVAKNKTIDRIKEHGYSSKRSPGGKNGSEKMDGSFVLL